VADARSVPFDLAIRDVHVPVLMVHGEEDTVIPLNSAKRLFDVADVAKQFIELSSRADHFRRIFHFYTLTPQSAGWNPRTNFSRLTRARPKTELPGDT
jgi:hypothetical protein